MGGRSGSNASSAVGAGGSGPIRRALSDKEAEAVARVVIGVLANSNPAIAAAYLAYQVASRVVPVVEKGAKTYAKTGDEEKATAAMKKEAVKQIKEEITDQVIEKTVGATYSAIKEQSGIKTDNVADDIVIEAVTEAVSQAVKENE